MTAEYVPGEGLSDEGANAYENGWNEGRSDLIDAWGDPVQLGQQVGELLATVAALRERVERAEGELGNAMRRLADGGWCVDHTFVVSEGHPADRSCQFVYDDFDGTECAYLEEDHFLGAGDCGVMDDFHGEDNP